MKTLIISLMLGIITTSVYAQITYHPFPTDSTQWVIKNVQYNTPPGPHHFSTYSHYLDGDTLINGQQYTLVKHDYGGTKTEIGAVREDSTKKVWFYNFGGLQYCPHNSFDSILQVGGETLLFDFNLQIGTGYRHKMIQALDGNHVLQIDSAYSELVGIDSIQLLDGSYRRLLDIKTTMISPFGSTDTLIRGSYWVDGIGALGMHNLDDLGHSNLAGQLPSYDKQHNGLFGMMTFYFAGSSPPSCATSINCFIENEVQLLGPNGIATCDTIVAVPIVEKEQIEVEVAPNPFQGQTTITIAGSPLDMELEVLIFNAVGQQVRAIRSADREIIIKRDRLPAGLYVYQILGNNKRIATGKLLMN